MTLMMLMEKVEALAITAEPASMNVIGARGSVDGGGACWFKSSNLCGANLNCWLFMMKLVSVLLFNTCSRCLAIVEKIMMVVVVVFLFLIRVG